MKIIHVQDIFHPEAGYQENVLSKYQALQGYDVTVVASEIDKVPDHILGFFGKEDIQKKDIDFMNETGVKLIRLPVYRYISGRAIYKRGVFKKISELNPDILFIHGNDTYIGMRYIFRLNKLKHPIIYDNHMVDVASHNKFRALYYFFYKKFCAPRLIQHEITVIRTENDDFVQRRLGFPVDLSPVIQFGSDLLLFKRDPKNRGEMRKALDISEETFVVIYAGKLDEYKGGLFLANSISERYGTSRKIEFVIVGNFVGEYGEKVKKTMEQSHNRIHYFPTQKYMDLPKFWQMADCAVIPKECSTTFFDAQACGLPVIAEDIDINKERLSHDNGYCYRKDSMEDFRDKICSIAGLPASEYGKMSQNAVQYVTENYNYMYIVERINQEISKTINRWRCRSRNENTAD